MLLADKCLLIYWARNGSLSGTTAFKDNSMARNCFFTILVLGVIGAVGGCVERQLTVKTVPTGGVVALNDEEIGEAPVTVSFEWYGDYNVRVSKAGYETLTTHQNLPRPWYDLFPFDFFASVVWPGTIRDKYEWTFDLKPYQEPSREQLIEEAKKLRQEAAAENISASADANDSAR
jgi:hypothetical protein